MRPADLRCAELFEDWIQASVGSTIAVDDDEAVVTRPQRMQLLAELLDDLFRVQVEHRRQSIDVDLPTAPIDDVLDLCA